MTKRNNDYIKITCKSITSSINTRGKTLPPSSQNRVSICLCRGGEE